MKILKMKQFHQSVNKFYSKRKYTGSLFSAISSILFFGIFCCLLAIIPTQYISAQTSNNLDLAGLPGDTSVAAYSVRKLSNTYSGPAMLVRRGSDNATVKVAFNASNVVGASSVVTLQVTNTALLNYSSFNLKTGKVQCTISSTTITGIGTTFMTQISIGDMLVDTILKKTIGIVQSISSNTSLTLASGALFTNANKGYAAIASSQAFSTFYSGASCYVTTWYDQSGNSAGRDLTTSSNPTQPRIVNAGSFDLNGTKPALYFNSVTSQFLSSLFTGITVSYPATISLVANTSGLSAGGVFAKFGKPAGFGIGVGNGGAGGTFTAGTSITGYRGNGSPAFSPASPDVKYPSTQFASTTIQELSLMRDYENGTGIPLLNYNIAPIGTTITGGLYLGVNGSTYTTVKESEVIIFSTALSNSDREDLECSQMTYFDILSATAGANQNVCNGLNSTPLGGNSVNSFFGITGRWSQQSGPGTTTFSSLINSASTATANQAGSYVYRWTVSNGTCEKYADITVNYSKPATAGIEQHICGSLVSDSLSANTPAIGTGKWSVVSGPGTVSFSSVDSSNAVATVTSYGSYILRWTITSGTCSPTTADINVSFSSSTNPPPTAVISGSATVCPGAASNISVALTGTGPWNLTYTDGSNEYNVSNILSSPYIFSVSPTVTTIYKINNLTDAYCIAQAANLTTTVVLTAAPSVTITPDYCLLGGGNIKLTADTHSTYLWSNGLTTKSVTVNQSGFYSVKVTDVAYPGCQATTTFSVGDELVYNGDFSLGNVGFTTQYTLPDSAKNCTNSTHGLYPSGTYDILANAQTDHCNFWGKDHSSGTGNFMAINGSVTTPKPDIWKTNSIAVKKNTRYYFSAWAMSMNNYSQTASVVFYIGNYQYGTVAALAAGINSNSNNGWTRFYGQWDSGDTTSVTISIVDISPATAGNDFGLDDISFSTLPPVGLSVTAGAIGGNSFCEGQSVDLLPVVTGGWSPLSYAWTYASGPSTIAQPNIPAITTADNNVSLTVTDKKGCQASTNFTLTINTDTWIGLNTNWYDPTNWTCGVPDSSRNATIPVVGSTIYPIISSGVAAVKNLTVNTNAKIYVQGAKLQIASTIINNGMFDATKGSLEFNGQALQTIKGSWFKGNTIKSLVVTNTFGLVVSNVSIDSLNILDSLSFGIDNAILNTGNNVVLVSNDTITARVSDITNGGAYSNNVISGKVTVQRYFPAKRAWRLLTSPLSNTGTVYNTWQNGGNYVVGKGMLVSGPNPTPANGLDASLQNNASLKTGSNLTPVLDTKSMNLSNNTGNADNIGYFAFVRGDRDPANTNITNTNNTTLSSKGTLQTGTQTFAASPVLGNFSLIGNPYASPIDFSTLILNNVLNRFYVWDPRLNLVGGYVTIDDIDGDGIYSYSVFGPGGQDTIIQSSQAFFVVTASNAPASIVFNENNKATENNLAMFRPASGAHPRHMSSLRISLYLPNTGSPALFGDGTMAEFAEQLSAGVDQQDAIKFNNINETVALIRNTRALAIERRPLITANDTLFLRLTKTTARKYRLDFIPTGLDPSLTAFLEDSYTATSTPLNMVGNTSYSFIINGDAASAKPDRFRIVFKTAGPLPVTFKTIKAYQQASNIAVEWEVGNELNIAKYEIEKSTDGINFVKVNTTSAMGANRTSTTYSWIDINPVTGNNFYRIRSIDQNGAFEFTRVVIVKTGKGTPAISVYPNPVTDGVIGVEFKNMQQGKYDLRLINSLGQVITIKRITHVAGTSMETMTPEGKMTTGTYQLEITAPDNNVSTIGVIVR